MNNPAEVKKPLILPLFDEEPLFCRCVSCSEPVEILLEDQRCFTRGGVGYSCKKCGTYFGVVMCPYCKCMHPIDVDGWETLRRLGEYECADCGKTSSFSVRTVSLKVSDTISFPILMNWTDSESEKVYLEGLNNESEAMLHRVIGSRIGLFRYDINIAKKNGFCGLGFYNNSNLESAFSEGKINADQFVFSACNLLVSALELLIHQIYLSLELGVNSKKKLFFNGDHLRLESVHPGVGGMICELQNNSDIDYLYRIRRRIHHRNFVPVSTRLVGHIEIPGPLTPSEFPRDVFHFLPDNPDPADGKFSYDCEHEIIRSFLSMHDAIASGASQIYARLGQRR